jgi:hypothetical protein
MSSAESVVSFSIILAEVFASVGMATVVPNMLVMGAKGTAGVLTALDEELKDAKEIPGAVKNGIHLLAAGAKNMDALELMIPKTADIHAEFTFQGTFKETLDVNGAGSGSIQSLGAVSVGAGFSALYESTSTNKITLDIHFVTVNVPLKTIPNP